EGDDLQIGGEGMQTFYNRIVPNVVRKEAKRLGLEIEPVPLLPDVDDFGQIGPPPREPTNLSVRITPEAREKIQREGQRLGATVPEIPGAVAGAGAGATAGAASAEEGEEGRGAAVG